MSETTHVFPRIDTARSIVQTERTIIHHEIEALEDFRTRLGQLESTVNGENIGTGGLVQTAPVAGIPPQQIRQAYRETLLDMAHYEEEYGEPLLEHVQGEFSPQIRALFESQKPLHPAQCQLLDRAVDDATTRRRKMVQELQREDDSLARVADRLAQIERQFMDQADPGQSHQIDRPELKRIQGRCDQLASERQQAIHKRPAARIAGIGDRSLIAYLYGGHEHRFPALRAIADLAAQVVEKLDN